MAHSAEDARGSLATALAHTRRLLDGRPDLAEVQAREILKVVPTSADTRLLLAMAQRAQGQAEAAADGLKALVDALPDFAAAQLELGLTLAQLGQGHQALAALMQAVTLDPDLSAGWRALGDINGLMGDTAAAEAAYTRAITAQVKDPELMEAALALSKGDNGAAEALLRDYLKRYPTDVAAIRMLAELGIRLGRYGDAQALLERALELAPGFTAARHNYALALHRAIKSEDALVQLDHLLAVDPRNPAYLSLRAAALGRIGEYAESIDIYARLLADYPNQPKVWMSQGHALKTVGRTSEAIEAYLKAIALAPGLGEAWWSLANLKTFRFTDAHLAAMRGALDDDSLEEDDRLHLDFALGKALEDRKDYEASFAHYAAGNALRRSQIFYSAEDTAEHLRRSMALFTPAFFGAREGWGCPDGDPVFIIGLPRAGSTLLEQILSSHSMVEGTQELPDIAAMALRQGGRKRRPTHSTYPDSLAELTAEDAAELGREYLERTRIQRKTGRPLFIDKMPNNFAHVGFIHLILPNARIIDARRHPMGNCFAAFKQHFARGQAFTYDLEELGRYYRDYVALMAHMDAVLPGRVHRVIYEAMVADAPGEVQALLAYCRLPFEPACLTFYENDRAVRTPSAEQVRQPIFTDAVDQWRNYAPWLGALAEALGPVTQCYPKAPPAA